MKKIVKILAFIAAIAMLTCSFACTEDKPQPVPVNTQEPVPAAFDRALLGDWYGVFAVSEAVGKYAPNLGISNDCALRMALGENGTGSCYCVINGIGEGLFKDCTATADGEGVTVAGTVAGENAEWRFNAMREADSRLSVLYASGVYGGGSDFMRISFTLRHCGDEWPEGVRPEGLDYTREYGFGGLVETFGGSLANVPAIEGEGVNLRLTTDEAHAAPVPAFDGEGRIISISGNFSVELPEGFELVRNDRSFFAVGNDDVTINYAFMESNQAPLEALAANMNGEAHDDVFHYDIDGWDCYATVTASGSGSTFILFGSKEPGRLLWISMATGLEPGELSAQLSGRTPEYFEQAVLGLLVR